ncbi:MAG: hypothetical protein Q7W56_05290 [Candidatus Latescibacteria bacterium]|nr:hypothetical protein [Candidatus Latescibacterota bacterium]
MANGVATVRIEGRPYEIVPGTPLLEVLAVHDLDGGADPVVLGVVNGQRTYLNEPLWGDETVGLMRLSHPKSHSTIQRTLVTVLAMACEELHPGHAIVVDFSYGDGMYCELRRDAPLLAGELAAIEARMRAIIAADRELKPVLYGPRALQRALRDTSRRQSREAACYVPAGTTVYCRPEGSRLLLQGLHLPSTAHAGAFALLPEPPGFVLMSSRPGAPDAIQPFAPQPKLLAALKDHTAWTTRQEIPDLGSINRLVAEGRAGELIAICEARHTRAVVGAADRVAALPDDGRLVLVSGPSSSGKTTFAKQLALMLRDHGLQPLSLSLDDFFVDREHTPRDSAGTFDYETIDALRLDLLDDTLAGLLAGREMRLPRYDFHTGRSVWREVPATLPTGSPLIVEGIHALNARLAADVPRRNTLRVYVSALTPTNIDDLTYMPTHLPRLFRRLVRDAQFRGYPAATTLQRWNSVREGEKKYIFPWQSNADLFFNTGLPYELGVLKLWAEPRLAAVPLQDPAFGRARGLLEFLGLHLPIDARLVPPTSLLREFIGESGFRY